MAETQPAEQPAAALQSRNIALPSGKSAAIRRGKGRDLMRAQRAVAGNPDPTAVVFALGVRSTMLTALLTFQLMVAMPVEPVASLTVTTVLEVPAFAGRPEMSPLLLIVSPRGSGVAVHVNVLSDLSESVAEG